MVHGAIAGLVPHVRHSMFRKSGRRFSATGVAGPVAKTVLKTFRVTCRVCGRRAVQAPTAFIHMVSG